MFGSVARGESNKSVDGDFLIEMEDCTSVYKFIVDWKLNLSFSTAQTASSQSRQMIIMICTVILRKHSILFSTIALSLMLVLGISAKQVFLGSSRPKVHVWMTTPDKTILLKQQPDIYFSADGIPNPLTIEVNSGQVAQDIDGFGAALTDTSAWLLFNRLSASQRDLVLHQLFDPVDGIGLSLIRLPVGASDFALSGYTYDDNDGSPDPLLENFSIQHDEDYIIPVLQEIRNINPNIKIFAVPWSAPAWMKTVNTLNGGQLKQKYYGAYAAYFLKFIQAYQSHGIPIYAVTIQNEPLNETSSYPSMLFPETSAVDFIKNYLSPAFMVNGIITKIIIWDHNWDNTDYPITVLGELASLRSLAGTAFHCYSGDVASQTVVHNADPSKGIYFTECSGWGINPDFGADLKWVTQNLTIGAVRNWAKAVFRWNLTLDTNHGPRIGGCDTCYGVVTINQDTGEVTYTLDYYALGHASKFVRPGAYRIDSNTFSGELEDVAFRNPNGSMVVLVLNSSSSEKAFMVRWSGKSFSYTLPAGAVATFTWNPSIFLPLVIR